MPQRDEHKGQVKIKKMVLNSRGRRRRLARWGTDPKFRSRPDPVVKAPPKPKGGGMVAVYSSDQWRLNNSAGSRAEWDALSLAEQQRIAGSWHIPLCEGPNHRYNY